jgi:AcrR family transcriptional regulator
MLYSLAGRVLHTRNTMATAHDDLPARVATGAQRAIAQHGWQGATLERIAEAAGLSRMTLHRRGLGREEIFALLARDYERDFRETLEPALAGGGTALERLQRALRAICDVTERHLPFLRGLDDEADTRLFHERERRVRSRPGYVDALERLLAEGIRDGSVRSVPVAETATLLVNATDRTYRHLRTAHGWSPTRARTELLTLLARGVAADGPPQASTTLAP